MQHFHLHMDFYNQPIRLTEEQMKEPMTVIQEFFRNFHLIDVRQNLWNWFETALTTEDGLFDGGLERSRLIHFYTQLEELAEAAYLIDQRERKKACKK